MSVEPDKMLDPVPNQPTVSTITFWRIEMTTLLIKDLARDAKELDRAAMAAVSGGYNNGNILGAGWESCFKFPTCYEPSAPSAPSVSTVTNTYNQSNNMQQGGNVQAANGSLIGGGVSISNNPYQYGINFAGGFPA
jgi:hypothetical protein